MAPSSMFSYLRPGHAKRNASNLALASPEPVSSPAMRTPLQDTDYFVSPRFLAADNASYSSASPISPFPPQLSSITSMASKPNSHKQDSEPAFIGPRALHAHTPQSASHLSPAIISPSFSTHSRSQTSLLLSGISEKLSGSSKNTSTPTVTKSKSRLSLRNPMSLLTRRRSGQTLVPLSDEALVTRRSPVPPMPDNFDPRIRGSIVHDFTVPRLNRNHSSDSNTGTPTKQDLGRVSPPKIEREHTPVFHEHFDDDTSYEQSKANIRAEQLANNDFVARNSMLLLGAVPSPLLPSTIPETPPPAPPPLTATPPPPPPSYQTIDVSPSVLSPVYEAHTPTSTSTDNTPRKKLSSKTPPPARSRATSVNDPSWQPAGLPAHLSSRASRFSFQIAGSDSTQEKVMEERHKQKAAEKASKEAHLSTQTIEDEYDEYDMDEYDMDGGLEEEIPMLGEEDEYSGLGNQSMNSGMNAFDFSKFSMQHGSDGYMGGFGQLQLGELQVPLDANGIPVGFAISAEKLRQIQNSDVDVFAIDELRELNLTGTQTEDTAETVSFSAPLGAGPSMANNQTLDDFDFDDDMYFDDGLIGEPGENDAAGFDENVFDDPNGPLYERKTKPPPVEEPSDVLSTNPSDILSSEIGYEADDDTMARHLEKTEPSLVHTTSVAQRYTMPDLTNMEAYHSALADAATRAEADGRFSRKTSVIAHQTSSDMEDVPSRSNSRPSLIPDDGQLSLDTIGFPSDDDGFDMGSTYVDDYDYDEYDSTMEEDPMIAAANAEALAFDDEGFYGREFGFYASAVGDSPNTWGGFFGPSALGRAASGRNAVREPSLTPITERSEYSTRNSFIGLNQFRDGLPLASPGLAQLARMSPYGFFSDDEDLSFDALMKLRKGAFGGDTASLPSASGSPVDSSPNGMQFAPRTPSAMGNCVIDLNENGAVNDESLEISDGYGGDEQEYDEEGLMDAVNAAYSDEDNSDEGDRDEGPESPTLNASDYDSLSSPVAHMSTDMPNPFPAGQFQAYNGMPVLSPFNLPLKSPGNVPVPMSPFSMPLASPFLSKQPHPSSPPPIDTSLSSPSTGPRRQSVGFASPISSSSPMTPNGSGWRDHSRKGSTADSVTYVREHDDAGEGRWVLERRRTAESGELELVGREIVEGGRI